MTAIQEPVTPAAAFDQPYEYARAELAEPDWRRFPGWHDVTDAEWRDAQWQRVHCVRNVKQLRALMGDLLEERFYDDLLADQRELATMSMLLPPQMLNTMAPTAGTDPAKVTEAFYADPIRRYMLPVTQRPRRDVAEPPPLRTRLAARGRDVGRRGPDPPLPDQGAGRDDLDLPPVLRPLHPDGPRRQLHRDGREAQADAQAGRPPGRDDRVPEEDPGRARRRGLRRRRRERAVAAAGVVPDAPDGHRHRSRHPPGDEGPGGAAAALAPAEGGRRPGARRRDRPAPRRQPGDPHPRQPRPVGDAAGGGGGPDSAECRASATSATRAC